MRISRKLAAVAAFFVIGAAVAGCGSSIPGNSVASVAGNPISLQAFNHWMYVAAKENAARYAQQGVNEPPIISSNPTNFSSCIKQIRAGIPQLRSTPEATLANDCKQVYTQDSTEVMNFFIQGYWMQAEAHRLGIDSSKITGKFNKAIKKQFTAKGALATYLKSSGQTKQDMLFQYRIQSLYAKLVKRQEKKVTSAQIASYYAAHKSAYGTPETRNLNQVMTKTQAQAQAAYNALKSGQSWTTVAKKYASQASAKANGGALTGVTNGQEESAANKAIFAAPLHALVGPIKGIFGYYVIEVTKINAATQESLAKATATIKSQLQSTSQTAAASKVAKSAQSHWKKKTSCRKNYQTTYCSNYVKPTTTTTSTTSTPTTSSTGTATTSSTGTSTATTASTTSTGSTSTTK
ncbi:MAG: peptidyl-prolyl cis-trans isomerase [Acidobacteriota bacterium]|nr:peptidyl-prolyl cis-trans isomerase [Acidobacteriota bacterium]